MKKSKFLKAIAVFTLSAAAAVGCITMAACTKKPSGSDQEQTQTTVNSLSISKNTLSLQEGASEKLTATVDPTTASVTWESSDTTKATVGTDGTVTAVAAGTATITAKAGDKTATCAVTVTAKGPAVDPSTQFETTAAYTFDANTNAKMVELGVKDKIGENIVLAEGAMTALANLPATDGTAQTGAELQIKPQGTGGLKLNMKGQGTSKGRWIKFELEKTAKIVITIRNGSGGKGNCQVNYCSSMDHSSAIADSCFVLDDGGAFEEKTILSAAGTFYLASQNVPEFDSTGGGNKTAFEVTKIEIFYAV